MSEPTWKDIMEEDAGLYKEDMPWDYSSDPEDQGCSELPPVFYSVADAIRMKGKGGVQV